jgi:hypothetical protein
VVTTTDTSTCTTYGDLASTSGPVVTTQIGAAAFIAVTCSAFNSGGNASWMAYDTSGATTIAASDDRSLQFNSASGMTFSAVYMQTGLTPGIHTFSAKYRISVGGTTTFSQRRIGVIPL